MKNLARLTDAKHLEIAASAWTFYTPERSEYQLRKFVVGQHDTPEMQYKQAMAETQALLLKIKMNEIQYERLRLDIEDLSKEQDERKRLDLAEKLINQEQLGALLTAAYRELGFLFNIIEELQTFTLDEIEQQQAVYWQARLTRQVELDQIAQQTGINVGNLQSYRSILDNGTTDTQKELEYEIR